jgi:hypothetical protein
VKGGGQVSEAFLLAFFEGGGAEGPGGAGVLATAEYIARRGACVVFPEGPAMGWGRGAEVAATWHMVFMLAVWTAWTAEMARSSSLI